MFFFEIFEILRSFSKLTIKNVSRIRKKTFYLKFYMGTPEGLQKSIFNTPKVKKKNKDAYEIYTTKFASSTQKH
jgi:hypothetical protein